MSAHNVHPTAADRPYPPRAGKRHRERRVEPDLAPTPFCSTSVGLAASTLPLPVLTPARPQSLVDHLVPGDTRGRSWLTPAASVCRQGLAALRKALPNDLRRHLEDGLWPEEPVASDAAGWQAEVARQRAEAPYASHDAANPFANARAATRERSGPQQATLARDANNALGLRLLAARWQTPGNGGSVALSPFSLARTLTMLAGAADPQQKAAFAAALLLPSGQALDEVGRAWREVGEASAQVRSASALFLGRSSWPQAGFAKHLSDAAVQIFAPQRDKRASCQAINAWVHVASHGRIGNIVTEDQLEDDGATLLDAVTFDGRWQDAFFRDNTEEWAQFWPRPGAAGPSHLPMMLHYRKSFSSLVTDQFDAVLLPYTSDPTRPPSTLFAALPKAELEVGKLLQIFLCHGLPARSLFAPRDFARLGLPKWEQQNTLDLSQDLCELGFPVREGFFGMLQGPYSTKVASLRQKVAVSMDERGTRAAAVTYACLAPTCAAPPSYRLIFDRPFVWAVLDEAGLALFVGTFAG